MLVLVGVGIGAVASSLSTMLLVVSPTDVAQKAFNWLLGSVYGSSWKHVNMLLPWFIVLGLLSLALSRRINMLQLGDDLAAGAGSSVEKTGRCSSLLRLVWRGQAFPSAGPSALLRCCRRISPGS